MSSTPKRPADKDGATESNLKKPCLRGAAGPSPAPFTTDEGYSDTVILRVEGKNLFVSRAVLAMASPVFERMFSADFKEKSSKTVELKGKTYSDMLEFLLCIHPGIQKPITEENVFRLIPIAHEYQHTRLLQLCQPALNMAFKKSIDIGYLFNGDKQLAPIKTADMYNMTKVIDEGAKDMSTHGSGSYRNGKTFLSLTDYTKYRILHERLTKLKD